VLTTRHLKQHVKRKKGQLVKDVAKQGRMRKYDPCFDQTSDISMMQMLSGHRAVGSVAMNKVAQDTSSEASNYPRQQAHWNSVPGRAELIL
jgi:hypothetical protein